MLFLNPFQWPWTVHSPFSAKGKGNTITEAYYPIDSHVKVCGAIKQAKRQFSEWYIRSHLDRLQGFWQAFLLCFLSLHLPVQSWKEHNYVMKVLERNYCPEGGKHSSRGGFQAEAWSTEDQECFSQLRKTKNKNDLFPLHSYSTYPGITTLKLLFDHYRLLINLTEKMDFHNYFVTFISSLSWEVSLEMIRTMKWG